MAPVFSSGQTVDVFDGPYAGVSGRAVGVSDNGKVLVDVNAGGLGVVLVNPVCIRVSDPVFGGSDE